MAILANAEHLEMLAEAAPALRHALEGVPLEPLHRRELSMILEDLGPIARDLKSAMRSIRELIDRLPDS